MKDNYKENGSGRTKTLAEQMAAEKLMRRLRSEGINLC